MVRIRRRCTSFRIWRNLLVPMRRDLAWPFVGDTIVQSGDDVPDTVQVSSFLGWIRPLSKIPWDLVEPLARIREPLSHEGLDHRLAQEGSMGLPIDHLDRNDLIPKPA